MLKRLTAYSEDFFCFSCNGTGSISNESHYFQDLTLKVHDNFSISEEEKKEIVDEAIYKLLVSMYDVFEKIIDIKSNFSDQHHRKVANYCLAMAQQIGLDSKYQNMAYYAGLLHDIGKVHIPDSILLKKGKLTADERSKMNLHSEFSWKFLKNISIIEAEATIAKNHHVFPFEGESLYLDITNILIIADAFDAMTNRREYNAKSKSNDEAKQEIENCLQTHFDKDIYEKAFLPWYNAGLPKPDTSILDVKNRFPEVFSKNHNVLEKLEIFLEIENGIFNFFIEVMKENDLNLRGCNPYKQAEYAYVIAKQCFNLPYNVCDIIYRGALFGHFGRMFLADSFNFKDPDNNNIKNKERIINKNEEVFSILPNFQDIATVTKFIFEDWDGKFSFFDKSGENIPLESRIIRVAYVYHLFGISGLEEMRGKELDPKIVDKFIEYLNKDNKKIVNNYLSSVG